MRDRVLKSTLKLVVCWVVLILMSIAAAAQSGDRLVLHKVDPIVPPIARQMNVEGTVRLQVTVTPDGHVVHIWPLGGNPILMEAAKAAVQQWQYARARKAAELEVAVVFKLPH